MRRPKLLPQLVLAVLGLMLAAGLPALLRAQQAAEPNLDFEIDTTPKDDVPDGWQIECKGGAKWEYSRGQAASGRWCVTTTHTDKSQTSVVTYPAAGLIQAGRWYQFRYWFMAKGDSSRFGFKLASADLSQMKELDTILEMPLTDGRWHLYTTSPFRVTEAELAAHPRIAFCHLDHVGSVAVDDISVVPSGPPD